MKRRYWIGLMAGCIGALLALGAAIASAHGAEVQRREAAGALTAGTVGSAFTYQGRLNFGGSPANGNYDFSFALYDAASGGNPVGLTYTYNDVPVTNGLFTIAIDLGYVYDGRAMWLQIGVRPAGPGGFTILSPRQELTAVPYAQSLRPGAVISGTDAYAALSIYNTSTAGYSNGISAQSYAPDGAAVSGYAADTNSLGTAQGVSGVTQAGSGTGVYGGALASTGGAIGVRGDSASTTGTGVHGQATATGGANYGVSGVSVSVNGTGVSGRAPYRAVFAWANATAGENYGVYSRSDSSDGYAGYFRNYGADGIALYAEGSGATRSKATLRVNNTETTNGMAAYLTNFSDYATAHFANSGSGDVLYLQNGGTDASGTGGGDFIRAVNYPESDPQFRVLTTGEVRSDVGFNTPAADFAEMLPAVDGLAPGDVLVIGPDGRLARSAEAYQPTVVGVYSTQPGFVGGQPMSGDAAGHVPLAVVGVVPVKASAENGAIRPGDLLVASSTPGHAMKAGANPSIGTVIGKALGSLDAGTGVIHMLVILQ